jgi:hypothetical protein
LADIENAVDDEDEDPTNQTYRLSEKQESGGDDDEQEEETRGGQVFGDSGKTEITGSGSTDNGGDDRHRRTAVSFQLEEEGNEQN